MVAEVWTLVLALQRLHGQHEPPRDAHLREAFERLPVSLHPVGRDVVEEHPHLDPTRDRVAERGEERRRRLVVGAKM